MSCGRREHYRTHAVNIAQCLGTSGKMNWTEFIKTGYLEEYRKPEIPLTPHYIAAVKRMRAQQRRVERN